MKKLTKGAIAAAAAVALLLGTGGTLAYWNDTQTLSGATITAGTLTLTQASTPSWQIKHTSGTLTPVTGSIANVRIVPGDQLVFTGNYTITAQGDNLEIAAAISGGAITAASAAPADVALKAALEDTAVISINGVTGSTASLGPVGQTSTTYPVVITVTLNWPFGTAGSGNTAKLGQVSLANFAITVTQVDGSL